ncbi:MAG: Factor arrest protein 11 [Thelocarpon impressellum]|nr:MAG: Factor arrest protein 11 [Thelocarpon impressellum]
MADEVDDAGVDITSAAPLNVTDTGPNITHGVEIPDTNAPRREESMREVPTTSILLPARPHIQRNHPQPPPPQQPPPPPTPQQQDDAENATDSLSLMQLRRIVTDMPRFEPTTYAFKYDDGASFPEELEEWFSYAVEEQAELLKARSSFDNRWRAFNAAAESPSAQPPDWTKTSEARRRDFVAKEVACLQGPDVHQSRVSLQVLVYVGLGVWAETAGNEESPANHVDDVDERQNQTEGRPEARFGDAGLQIKWIANAATTLCQCKGIQAVFDVLRNVCLREWDERSEIQDPTQDGPSFSDAEAQELGNALTLMYLLVESGRMKVAAGSSLDLRDEIAALQPDYLQFLVRLVAKLRWDESTDLPVRKIFLLFWKSISLLFGGTPELESTKDATLGHEGRTSEDDAKTRITASPLDYHVFRQEITSKYPAYNPPPPLIPLETENNSILPPLSNHPSRAGNVDPPLGVGPANVNGNGGSILHQPVHIATPAPSPPPSPIGPGGKAGKKQNYQTNQNFPFLYPPLDSSSNSRGGKGSAEIQDALVGRKWEGSDVPISILEAGELFAGRMRMTRAMQQLWEERELYLKFERGWGGLSEDGEDGEDGEDEKAAGDDHGRSGPARTGSDVERRLAAVEAFYVRVKAARPQHPLTRAAQRNALPHLQSLVIVLLKVVLANVTSLITQPNGTTGQNGLAPGFQAHEQSNGVGPPRARGNTGSMQDPLNEHNGGPADMAGLSIDELDAMRSREITSKAVSGLLLLLLKWFKVSHVLKYEYLTQLLLDSNYLPLILKLFAFQDLDKAVESKTDRDDLQFFTMCRNLARQGSAEDRADGESEDEACPPPVIRLRRDQRPSAQAEAGQTTERSATNPKAPEVDELGYPTSDPPAEPITSFSWRNFFSAINYLRIMQKICKNKAHRNLLLVQYKSSTILKKSLKVPQPQVRLYTLKLFKGQVPYCGRKWRQTNMRVITAVYLYCRPELREDWLAGSDVDAEVEEALPLEQALRALTHWHNLKRYPEQMGAGTGVLEEEQDFFIRELEKMDFGDDGASAGDEANGDRMWEGPLHVEGW